MMVKRILVLVMLFSVLFMNPAMGDNGNGKIELQQTTITSPIQLFNDTILENYSAGEGLKSDPYILDIDISGPSNQILIHIANTTKYFEIQEPTLEGGYIGVVFENVTHGSIVGGEIYDNAYGGVHFIDTNRSTVYDVEIYNNIHYGVFLEDSNYNNVSSNSIYNHNGTHSLLALSHSGGDGVVLDPSNHNIVYDNTITNNDRTGVYAEYSTNATVYQNTISYSDYCIHFYNMNASIIMDNDLSNCLYGLYIELSNFISDYDNVFSSITSNTYVTDATVLTQSPTLPPGFTFDTDGITDGGFVKFPAILIALVSTGIMIRRKLRR